MNKPIILKSMVFILMTMVVSIKTCEAAPASQIDGKWEGMLTGCCYGVVYDFTFNKLPIETGIPTHYMSREYCDL